MKLSSDILKEIIPSTTIGREIDAHGKHIVEFDKKFPVSACLFSFNYNFKLTPAYHDYLEIGYIVEGKGILNIENKKFFIKKDDIIVLGNHELHTWAKYKNEGFIIMVIFFLPEIIFRAGGAEVDFEYLRPFLFRTSNFKNVIHPENIEYKKVAGDMQKIYQLIHTKPVNYKIESKTLLIDTLFKIVKYYEKVKFKADKSYLKKLEDINRLKELMVLLQQEYKRNITLEEASRKVNMSLHYFCKFFKRVVGQTFTNYLLSIKIDRAKELILTEKLTITNIAYKVGFENLSYFYRKFKKLTGVSPKEFKQLTQKLK